MTTIKLEGNTEQSKGIYYEYDPYSTPLGIGGMGKVFKGRQVCKSTNSVTDVAIKFMFEVLPVSFIERARREASIQIDNENLLKMMGFVQTEETSVLGEIKYRYHVVSELLDGIVLSDLLDGNIDSQTNDHVFARKLYAEHKESPYQFALTVIKSILSGIMALHDSGYIHRDIDPSNIMITKDGKIKLIDFGIAKQLSSLNTTDKTLTSAGVFIGKPKYAAPELVLGDINHQGRTTDIYSVGILLYQLITGHLPFEGPDHIILNAQLHRNVPLNEIKQSKLRTIIKKATAKNQNERYQSAAEFRVAIEQIEELSYPDRYIRFPFGLVDNKKKTVLSFSASFILIACIGLYLNGKEIFPDPRNKTVEKNVAPTASTPSDTSEFKGAVALLMNKETANEGFDKVKNLSERNYPEATYLLSRIYYGGKSNTDSIKTMQKNLAKENIPDNQLSHELIKKAVRADSSNYKALYELGSNYLGGKVRTNLDIRNIDSASYLLNKGLQQAKDNNDSYYVEKFKNQLNQIPGKQ